MLTVGCSFKGLDEVKSYVWQAVLKKWVDNNRVDCTRSGCTLLGNNRKVTCQGQVCFKDWIKAGIMNAADTFFEIAKQCMPAKTILVRQRDALWLNDEIRILIEKREKKSQKSKTK